MRIHRAQRSNSARQYDLVLWGATGFTGRLVAERLARLELEGTLRWALAGRSRAKLERLRSELSAIDSRAAELPIELGDSHDHHALTALAGKTAVVCSTVGPYARYGSPLVGACVERGTHYCDLTGEVQWVRKMIDRHHEQAAASGARIVHCCGFDSIPFDIGCLMVQEQARQQHGAPCERVGLQVLRLSGGYSGGTVASMMNLFEEASRDRAVRAVLRDPYALNPETERSGPPAADQLGLGRAADAHGWTAPFMMAAVNTRVVRRSNALLGWPYGRDFRYTEQLHFEPGAGGLWRAALATAGAIGLSASMALPPGRALLRRFVAPAPGEGPSRAQQARGRFALRLVGHGHAPDGKPFALEGRVAGKGDPGYSQTAVMLSESALCLALDGSELDSPGGVLTPAACMGTRLLDRLRRAGMTFEVGEG